MECSLHKISKTRPPNECSQSDLFQNFFPNSSLQADYFEFQGGDYMTVVVFICRGKTTEEARVIRQWVSLYGRCLEIRTDSGPAFRSNFEEGLRAMGINLNHSSAYSPQSNSSEEQTLESTSIG